MDPKEIQILEDQLTQAAQALLASDPNAVLRIYRAVERAMKADVEPSARAS